MLTGTMLLYTLFFLQVVSISLCFDIELEGSLQFGKDLMKRFGSIILPLELNAVEPPKNRPAVRLMAAEPENSIQPSDSDSDMDKKADHQILGMKNNKLSESGMLNMNRTDEVMIGPTEDPLKVKEPDGKFQFNFKQQLSKNGSLRLKMLAYFIKNNLNPYTDITTVLRNSTEDYLAIVDKYYDFISKKSIMNDIDKEFVVMDMIESTNMILMNEAKKLLDYIIEVTSANKSKIDMPMLMEKIKNTVLEEKKEEFRYACKLFDVCRPFPGYSDHIADLLSKLLQLDDYSFKDIMRNLNETIFIKRNFFKTIMRENVYNLVSSKLKTSLYNIAYMKEVFSILRSVITQRYKIFKSDSLVVKIKTKAVRILLDLIDKAFDVNDDEVNYIEIENTINSYKQWALGDRTDVDMITKKFIYNAVEILNYNWGKGTKEEVKVLTDVIFTGATKNNGLYDYLFTKGSTLVRGELIQDHTDIE